MIHRRSFITGLVSLVAAPAIVRAGSLMPVKVMPVELDLCAMMEALLEDAHRRMYPAMLPGLPAVTFRGFNSAFHTSST